MERSLVKLADKFRYQEADREILMALESAMREDISHPSAKLALDAIDENTVHTEEDFNELLVAINEFTLTSAETNSGEIEYNYTPPAGVSLEEFGIGDRSEPGKFYFYESGKRVEKRSFGDEFITVGPVDEVNRPVEGHPEYIRLDIAERRTVKTKILPNTLEAAPEVIIDLSQPQVAEPTSEEEEYIYEKFKDQLESLDSLVEEAQLTYEESKMIQNKGGHEFLEASKEILHNRIEDNKMHRPSRKVHSVRAHLPNIGMFEYDVVGFIPSMHSITLVFDPKIAKPPFYPETRLTFTLEYEGHVYPVVYLGTCFDFEGLKYMCFNTGE